ncbi:MAG TPA: hypothetical protein VFW51_04405, partial [Actinomycetota bacterium]|nr:hypothetical protein [Actinomycetota bacterium]
MTTGPTPPSRSARWPWAVLALGAGFASLGLVFTSLNGDPLIGEVTNFFAFMGMGVVGALSLSRAPGNRIGALLLWVAVSVGAAFATAQWSTYLFEHGGRTAAGWVGWPGNTLWALS